MVFSPDRLRAAVSRFRAFVDGLPFETEVYYSYKTNYLPALCEELDRGGIGAEITSLVEWVLARSLYPPSRIVVNGIGKASDGLLRQVATGDDQPRLINLETDTEVDTIRTARADGRILKVGLRVCVPSISGERGSDPSEHWRRGTAKFGWTDDGVAVVDAARKITANRAATLEALHLHLGSQIVSARLYNTALTRVCDLLERLRAAGVRSVTTLDLGGGLASGWVTKRRTGPFFELLRATGVPIPARAQHDPDLNGITAVIRDHAARLRALGISRLIFEPGRFLAEPSMLAVASVVALRRDGARRHAVLDLGTNALHCWRSNETRPIAFDWPRTGQLERQERVSLVGPLCHRSDTFGVVSAPAGLAPGTLVCLDAVGAYSLGDWIANTWCRPAVVGADGDLLWRRQTIDEVTAPACSPRGSQT
jgi:diaminopimelate decarboxylase